MLKRIVGIRENLNALIVKNSTILRKNVVKNQQASVSETMNDENKLFYACQNSTNQKDAWLIDSGYTNHMTKHFHIFTEIDSLLKF